LYIAPRARVYTTPAVNGLSISPELMFVG